MKINKKNVLLAIGLLTICAVINVLHKIDGALMAYELAWAARILIIAIFSWFSFQKKSLTWWTFTAMIAGAEFGHDFPVIGKELDVLSALFLKLIKCIIAPLIFSTLVVGIAGHSNIKQVGRMGWKSILYFEIVTTIALFIGLVAINITQAGVGFHVPDELSSNALPTIVKHGWKELILDIFPENFAKSIAEGQVLQVVVFSIIFAVGLAMVKSEKKQIMLTWLEALSEIMFKFTDIVMFFVPIGVFGAMAVTASKLHIESFKYFAYLIMTLYAALIVFVLLVLLPLALLCKINIVKFIKTMAEPVTIAFSTASSEAAMPLAMEKMIEFGVPKKIVSFVLPTGYSFNLDGTTLYLSMASIFVAQAAGLHMSVGTQIVMMLTLMLTSKGVAGVRSASLVILLGTASQFGLPEKIIASMFAFDIFMDMARTSINLIGNCMASVVIAKWEGEFIETEDLSDSLQTS